ncbi:ComF family protein [Halomonas sp. Bachu 37]|uniref:ComF family protein n=1 Tax=Halomonas kashgarensis TaxID=3084920 RepID=UPI003217108F
MISPPLFESAHVPLLYEGAVANLISEFKFDASPRAGNVLLELFLTRSPARFPQALLPVPLHSARARERGFNQAYWLARQLGAEFDLPLVYGKRTSNTQSQRPLGRRERFKNMRGAFAVPDKVPAHLVIVDDVLTTGSTAHALACAAREAGAITVDVWAMARTKPVHG